MQADYRIRMRRSHHVILAAEPDHAFVVSITGEIPSELLEALPDQTDPNAPHKRVRLVLGVTELEDAPDGPAGERIEFPPAPDAE